MTTGNNAAFNSYKLLSQKAELLALDDYQLKDLLSYASRLKDDSISPRFSQSIIEGNFLDDFSLLKSGVTPTW
jgi:hypothetical protein